VTQPAAASSSSLPVTADALAAAIVALYAQAEQQLMIDLAAIARRGIESGQQAEMLAQMQRAAERTATMLRAQAYPQAQRIADIAARDGSAAAVTALRRAIGSDPALLARYLAPGGHAAAAANQIVLDLAQRLDAAAFRITRFADDAYRAAVAEAASRVVGGWAHGPAQAGAWDRLMAQGITGYRDTAGRNWNLSTYIEMATRTAVQRAYNAAHLDRLAALGIEYLTISHDGHPCPLCRPWEGAILTASGPIGAVRTQAADRDRTVTFIVTGTLEQATAEGLFHPNCRHVPLPYLPGVTRVTGGRDWTKADQALYDATQQLRALERRIRSYKRQEAAALDDVSRRRAARNVRATQAMIRAHVDRHHLVRRRHREQLDLGNR
jgi:hypothetical protein